jgi:arsenate reductase
VKLTSEAPAARLLAIPSAMAERQMFPVQTNTTLVMRKRYCSRSAEMGNPMKRQKPTVLFLCVHNAGRSQMAAAWLQRLAGDQVTVLSGGSSPTDEVNPAAVAVMAEAGVDLTGATPKQWSDDMVQLADVVITMGCGDECPYYPGKHYEDWDVADPHNGDIDLVRAVRDDIESRVRRLLQALREVYGTSDRCR